MVFPSPGRSRRCSRLPISTTKGRRRNSRRTSRARGASYQPVLGKATWPEKVERVHTLMMRAHSKMGSSRWSSIATSQAGVAFDAARFKPDTAHGDGHPHERLCIRRSVPQRGRRTRSGYGPCQRPSFPVRQPSPTGTTWYRKGRSPHPRSVYVKPASRCRWSDD